MSKISTFWLSVLLLMVAIGLANFIFSEPKFNSDDEHYRYYYNNELYYPAQDLAFSKVQQNNADLYWNVKYVKAHYRIPESTRVYKHIEYRDDKVIEGFYESLITSPDSTIQDIGNYCRGLGESMKENHENALRYFRAVNNHELKYLNNSIGYCLLSAKSDSAEYYFRKEIALKGNLDGAYSNLFSLLIDQSRLVEASQYLSDTSLAQYFGSHERRALYFRNQQLYPYAHEVYNRFAHSANIAGVIAAFLVLVCWAIYMYRIDFFEKEGWILVPVVIVTGMVFSFLVEPVSDYINLVIGFKLNGNIINDFIYCVVGIGMVEELCKILPLIILMLAYPQIINEPYDYILYASLSALGFAFAENILYFDTYGLGSIFGRALSSTVFHMFCTSVIAYGFIMNNYVKHRNPIIVFIVCFFLASTLHGFYDFWLINKYVHVFTIFSTLVLVVALTIWDAMIQNALNNSTFFSYNIKPDVVDIKRALTLSLVGILIFEVYSVGFTQGLPMANRSVFLSLYNGAYLMLFVGGLLSSFKPAQGKWKALEILDKFSLFSTINPFIVNSTKILGRMVQLEPKSGDEILNKYLPANAKLVQSIKVDNAGGWYLAQLDHATVIDGFSADKLLLKPASLYLLENNFNVNVAVYAIRLPTGINRNMLASSEIKFIKYAKLLSA